MDENLVLLRQLIDATEGAAAQLKLAHDAANEGRHAESQIHCALAADAIAIANPEFITDPVRLSKALQRLFTEQ